MASDTYPDRMAHLLASGVLELEADVVAKGAAPNPTLEAVRAFCKGPLTFCLLLGGPGTGKTIAAAEALLNAKGYWGSGKEWAFLPTEARLVLASDLARLSYFDSEGQRTLSRMERYPWLVVDDLGGELLTDTWRSNFTELVLRRNSARQKTLLTTNLTVEDFKARYDARVVSRIRGSGVVVNAGALDMRKPLEAA
jgi:DNA replication protein DnaC